MKRIQKAIRYLYWLIVPTLVLAITLAIIFYPERYMFFQEYICNLGGQFSRSGFPNQVSSIIMTVGFGICAASATVISILYFANDFRRKYLKGSLCLLIALGASLTAIPQDYGNLLIPHTIGASTFIAVFGILNFVLQVLRFTTKHQEIPEERKFDFYFDAFLVALILVIIFILVIVFIVAETTKHPTVIIISIVFQKLVLIVDLIAILVLDLDDI